MLSLVLIIVLSYLVGAIPGSLWAGKWLYGVDIREYGSHNSGATNAFRVCGWKAGTLATLIDFGKGLAAAGFIAQIRIDAVPALGPEAWATAVLVGMIATLAAIFGHMFPVWANFEGGKGVNTAAGALFALSPITMTLTLLIFAIVLFSSRYVSLASMTGAVAFPSIVAIRKYAFGADLDPSLLIFTVLLGLAVIIAHQSNIRRLLQGNENQVNSFRPAKGMVGRGEIDV